MPNWHSKKEAYKRARQMGVEEDLPEGNPMEACDVCPRSQSVDMLMRYQGKYLCDGCWTRLRRQGELGKPR